MAMAGVNQSDEAIPTSAAFLGAIGLLPFYGLAVAAMVPGMPLGDVAVAWMLAYGAAILSFMGGIQWGLTIQPEQTGPSTPVRLTVSIIPAFLGWIALLVTPEMGLPLLTAGFLAALIVDIQWQHRGWAPGWYPRLRIPLTSVVALSLLAVRLSQLI